MLLGVPVFSWHLRNGALIGLSYDAHVNIHKEKVLGAMSHIECACKFRAFEPEILSAIAKENKQ